MTTFAFTLALVAVMGWWLCTIIWNHAYGVGYGDGYKEATRKQRRL